MIHDHIIGLPIIGKNRELKFSIEKYINKEKKYKKKRLINSIKKIIKQNIKIQRNLDITTVGIFNYPDPIIYTSICLGIIKKKYIKKTLIDTIILITKGNKKLEAFKMTKWLGTNFHYFIPKIEKKYNKKTNINFIKYEISLLKKIKKNKNKVALIGPYTLLKASNLKEKTKKKLTKNIIKKYLILIKKLKKKKIKYIQLEEPKLNDDIKKKEIIFFKKLYKVLNKNNKIITTNYFNKIKKNIKYINSYGIHIDLINGKYKKKTLKKFKLISLGIINGENIWICNMKKIIKLIKKFKYHKKILITANCSLKHIPYDNKNEGKEIKDFLSFTLQKIKELNNIKTIINSQVKTKQFKINNLINKKFSSFKKKHSYKITNIKIKKKPKIKMNDINIKNLPITTIGSFPQTKYIRKLRKNLNKKIINKKLYNNKIIKEINKTIKKQKKYKINIMTNGEIERNDMVQYFCEMIKGCYISKNGWVQSYCTRCTKPPIIWGKIKFKNFKKEYKFLKPLKKLKKNEKKFIITGPITITKWAFIREDINIKNIIYNLSNRISKIIKNIYKKGIRIIQIDEPAIIEFIEKKSIKKAKNIAIKAFNICTQKIIKKKLQIHTHICYSKINKKEINIFKKMNIDVISIESSRNINNIIKKIKKFNLKKYMEIGIGIYNVHTNIIPKKKKLEEKINLIIKNLGFKKIWINPDCGLKTRKKKETNIFFKRLKKVVKKIREKIKIKGFKKQS